MTTTERRREYQAGILGRMTPEELVAAMLQKQRDRDRQYRGEDSPDGLWCYSVKAELSRRDIGEWAAAERARLKTLPPLDVLRAADAAFDRCQHREE